MTEPLPSIIASLRKLNVKEAAARLMEFESNAAFLLPIGNGKYVAGGSPEDISLLLKNVGAGDE